MLLTCEEYGKTYTAKFTETGVGDQMHVQGYRLSCVGTSELWPHLPIAELKLPGASDVLPFQRAA